MATIYDAETAVTITDGLQGCTVCDEAVISAKSLAEMREEDGILIFTQKHFRHIMVSSPGQAVT